MAAGNWLAANWDAPSLIRAGTTTRQGGFSRSPFDSFNLAYHVDDDPAAVQKNRRRLRQQLTLPADPLWLEQSHSNRVIQAGATRINTADAAWTGTPGMVCTILTADCVPLLLCDRSGSRIAAVHVGWRGLCAGIIDHTLEAMNRPTTSLLAWLGPHICGRHYEVGDDVRDACLKRYPGGGPAFRQNRHGRWQCSLETLISGHLEQQGIAVTSSGQCTYGQADRFYSYRRETRTGRMASLIWMDNTAI